MDFGGIRALDQIDMDVNTGEIAALIRPNGAGKTTLFNCITGLYTPTRGEIRFMGRPIHLLKPDAIVKSGISQVPEGRRIFPFLTVMENLAMGAFLRKDSHAVRRDIEWVFDLFPILGKRRHANGGSLSGGEQQMLAISRAIMARPGLLLLDEPSLGLAPLVVKQIFEIIRKLNRTHGATILLVEQNAGLALKLAHRGYVMENGKITITGTSDRLLSDENVKKAYLGM